jgi:hypothetical protein
MHKSRYFFIGILVALHFSSAFAAQASAQERSGPASSKSTAVKIAQPSSNSSTSSTESEEKIKSAHVAATPVPDLHHDPYEGWQPGFFTIPGTNNQVSCRYLPTSCNLSLCITEYGMFEKTHCIDWKLTGRKTPPYKPPATIQITPPSSKSSAVLAILKNLFPTIS